MKIIIGADDICLSCPHLDAGTCARSGEEINAADRRVMEWLGLEEGDRLEWRSLLKKTTAAVQPEDLSHLCGVCRWRELNYCSEGLTALKED